MCSTPTGAVSSTTRSAVILREFRMFSASEASWSDRTVRGPVS